MAAIVLPHRWTRQPQGPSRVDWSNPLAKDLIVAWNAAFPAANAVTGRPAVLKNGIAPGDMPGQSLKFEGTAGSTTCHYVSIPWEFGFLAAGGGMSLVSIYQEQNPIGSYRRHLRIYDGGFERVRIFHEATGASLGYRVVDGIGGGIDQRASVGSVAADGVYAIGVSYPWGNSVTGHRIRDSAYVSSTTGASGNPTPGVAVATEIGINTDDNYQPGRIDCSVWLLWNRNLEKGELESAVRFPWQFFAPLRRRLYFAPAAAGQTITVNQASETDLAQAVTRSKLKALGQPAETDLAQAVARGKLKALGQPAETDVAQALTAAKRAALGQVAETDQAQTVTRGGVFQAVNQATETATAQAIARLKTVALAQATESDSAQAVARSKRKTLGQPAESDAAQALAHAKAKLLGQAAETDLAQTVTPELPNQLSAAAETDSAQAVARAKAKAVGQSAETDLAQAVSRAKTGGVGLALEIDLGQPVVWAPKHRLVAPALETDLAQAIVPGLASTVLPKGKRHLVGARATHIVGARRAFGVDP